MNAKAKVARKSRSAQRTVPFTAIIIVVIALGVLLGVLYMSGCGSDSHSGTPQSEAGKPQPGSAQPDKNNVADKASSASSAPGSKTKDNPQAAERANTTNSKPAAHHSLASGAPGKLAIIIDDCGYSSSALTKLAQIDAPLTFSVIPYLTYSKTAIDKALGSGKQVMLHLPMQALGNASAEKITIKISMSDDQIKEITTNAINATPGLVGVNNHEGSKATADARVMRDVMGVVAGNGLFFVDSRTNPASVACDIAAEYGVATGANDLFLDNTDDVKYVEDRLRKAADMAHNRSIIAIGHARTNTAQAINAMLEDIRAAGIQLVFASEIVH